MHSNGFYTGPNIRIILHECYVICHVALPDLISMISLVISHDGQTKHFALFNLWNRKPWALSVQYICTFQWRPLFAQGVTSPLALKRQQSITPCITDRETLPDVSGDKDPSSPHLSDKGLSSPLVRSRENSFIHRGGLSDRFSHILMVLW